MCGGGGCTTDRNMIIVDITKNDKITNDHDSNTIPVHYIYKYTKNMSEIMQPNKRDSVKSVVPLTQHPSAYPAR